MTRHDHGRDATNAGRPSASFICVVVAAMIMTAGLVIDGGQKIAAATRAEVAAAGAARAAANARATGALGGSSSAGAAVLAARTYLAGQPGVTGTVGVSNGVVTVRHRHDGTHDLPGDHRYPIGLGARARPQPSWSRPEAADDHSAATRCGAPTHLGNRMSIETEPRPRAERTSGLFAATESPTPAGGRSATVAGHPWAAATPRPAQPEVDRSRSRRHLHRRAALVPHLRPGGNGDRRGRPRRTRSIAGRPWPHRISPRSP